MRLFIRKAIQDILNNRYLNSITIITIALSIVIVSAFGLFFVNASDFIHSWKKGLRIMTYLQGDVTEAERLNIRHSILNQAGVLSARFISKEEALLRMKQQIKQQASFLTDLVENPLPDAFEVQVEASRLSASGVEGLAKRIAALPAVEEVEYGQKWLNRFTQIFNLFRFSGYALGALFLMAAVFIVANTIRLVLYSRSQEMEIMRLVGATDRFIKTPFYIQGIIQGFLGGFIGLTGLYLAFLTVSAKVGYGISGAVLQIRFFSFPTILGILLGGMIVGWLGCFLSLKQFFKTL